MGVSYSRILKPGHANVLTDIIWLSKQVQRVLAGIVHEDSNSEEHVDEVQIQMQPRPDGGLAIIGWIDREAVKGIPDEQINEEIEEVATVPSPDEIATNLNPASGQPSPFQR